MEKERASKVIPQGDARPAPLHGLILLCVMPPLLLRISSLLGTSFLMYRDFLLRPQARLHTWKEFDFVRIFC